MSEMVKCPKCGETVEKGAETCPNCGEPIKDYFVWKEVLEKLDK